MADLATRTRLLWLSLVLPFAGSTALGQPADTAPTLRIEISIAARRLWVIDREIDTLYRAPVAVGSGRKLESADRTWTFRTPTGLTKVVAKEADPIWVPPDWHYIEIAREHGLRVERLAANDMVVLSRNRLIVVNGLVIGLVDTDSIFRPLPADEEIIFDSTLFIPPYGSAQRRIPGVLGPYRLKLANGVGLHGTPYTESIGKAVTHGCIRLLDADVTWLYENIPIGTMVVIRP